MIGSRGKASYSLRPTIATRSAAPARACLVTGRYSWQLAEACNHNPFLSDKWVFYPLLLEEAGYYVGYTGKGWGPGIYQTSDASRSLDKANPAGNPFFGTSAFSLAVGNRYSFRHSSQIIGSPNVSTWFTSNQILSDTLVNGKQYFVFDDGMKLRADEKTVYQLENGSEIVYFSFNVSVGDTVVFEEWRLHH